jgi:cytochrome P450 family 142 subfamily A polypeptide 1
MIQFRVLDPEFYAGDPFPTYARLRREDPVHWDDEARCWVVTRHADVTYVSKRTDLFCSGRGVMVDTDDAISIVTMDDPRHAELRRLISRGFTPRMVSLLETRIEEIVTACIDAIAPLGACDLTQAIAVPVPLLVIAEMIGIRPEDRARFAEWSDTMVLAAGRTSDPEILERAGRAYAEYAEYLQDVFAERRRAPREDLVSVLVAAQADGKLAAHETIAHDELQMFMTLLLVAGNETTRNAISGGMAAFSRFPEEWARLRAHPELLASAVEEVIRFVTPVVGFRRTALRDTELRGRRIAAGDKVVVLYQAANRDEEVFDEPERLRIDRDPNDHLAFGIGAHYCLGANLARAEVRIVLRELLRRLPDIRVAPGAGPVRAPSPLVAAIESLPVVYTPESARADAGAPRSLPAGGPRP